MIIILIIISFAQIKQANIVIQNGLNGFDTVREAGFWIKENYQPGDKMITSFLPMLTYYADREIVTFPGYEEELLQKIENPSNDPNIEQCQNLQKTNSVELFIQ